MAKRKNIKVFISDDHAVARKGITEILHDYGINTVGEAATVKETLEHCFDKHPDVLVIDLNMNGDNGISTIEKILDLHSEAKIVVFSMRESLNIIHATYKMGAKGYATKSSGPEVLADAIKKVASGKNYYMPGVAEEILDYDTRAHKEVDPRAVLTEKELIIFTRLAEGKSNEEIAEELGLTTKSVANRALDIKNKLGVRYTSFEWIARKYNLLKLDL